MHPSPQTIFSTIVNNLLTWFAPTDEEPTHIQDLKKDLKLLRQGRMILAFAETQIESTGHATIVFTSNGIATQVLSSISNSNSQPQRSFNNNSSEGVSHQSSTQIGNYILSSVDFRDMRGNVRVQNGVVTISGDESAVMAGVRVCSRDGDEVVVRTVDVGEYDVLWREADREIEIAVDDINFFREELAEQIAERQLLREDLD